jgi:2-polyprenyl-6-methoxyphenol hydroxylase-like FAD-dependent oxidoreductase
LAAQGIACEIIDKAPFSRRQGYTVGLTLNGWNVAQSLRILESLKHSALSFGAAEFRDSQNKKLFSYNYEHVIQAAKGKVFTMPRDRLQDVLLTALDGRVPIAFEETIVGLEEHACGIDVTFSSGEKKTFDLVIGADGYRSGVRALVFGPHEQFLRPLGYRTAAWRFSLKEPFSQGVMGFMDVNKQASIYPIGPRFGEALFCWKDEDTRRVPSHERGALLKKHFSNWPQSLQWVLNAQEDWSEIFLDTIYHVEVERWWKGRVVLLGDAAHCLTYLSGQGPSTAMAGAYILAAELCQKPLPFALKSYEDCMQPFVKKLQLQAHKIAGYYIPESRSGLWWQATMMSLFLKRPLLGLTARKFLGQELPLQQIRQETERPLLKAA